MEANPDKFKKLPPNEVYDDMRKAIELTGGKLIYIDKTCWYNTLTRCKAKVKDIPIFAFKDTSHRPKAILEIKVWKIEKSITDYMAERNLENRPSYENADTSSVLRALCNYDNYDKYDTYVFNKDLNHININDEQCSVTFFGDTYAFELKYDSICNPITQHHFYQHPKDELTLLFKGQLMGQNGNSPFRRNQSVATVYKDFSIRDEAGTFLKKSAPIIQLITKRSTYALNTPDRINLALTGLKIPQNDNEIMVKYINDDYYQVVSKETYEQAKQNNELSDYYLPISYNDVQHILENIPDEEIDLACLGLGSAGTGILDQVARGNWFSKYYICDFDTVEGHNLYNQWYVSSDIGNYKTNGSDRALHSMSSKGISINKKLDKFQNENWNKKNIKYIIAGFDSIEARLELLSYLEEGKIKAKYLIDARYLDLSASVYFVNLSNEKEVEYYKTLLKEDYEAFKNNKVFVTDKNSFYQWLEQESALDSKCYTTIESLIKLLREQEIPHPICSKRIDTGCAMHCRRVNCINYWDQIIEETKPIWNKLEIKQQQNNSCIHENYIDIYKYASAYVFSAIREIEADEPKPFTHVEVQTDKLPKGMVVRK